MIILISPAKTFAKPITSFESTPIFQNEALSMISKLKKLSVSTLMSKMKISKDLAQKVKNDYMNFGKESSAAIYSYDGYAYKGFDVHHMDSNTLSYLKNHLYILSGLYGMIRPYDGISHYRLEMKDQIIKNLYHFWQPKIKSYLMENHPNELLINLSSAEYSKVIDTSLPMLTLTFYQKTDHELKALSMHVKLMRGKMANHILTHQIESPEQIKEISVDGYHYEKNLSTEQEYVFIKEITK